MATSNEINLTHLVIREINLAFDNHMKNSASEVSLDRQNHAFNFISSILPHLLSKYSKKPFFEALIDQVMKQFIEDKINPLNPANGNEVNGDKAFSREEIKGGDEKLKIGQLQCILAELFTTEISYHQQLSKYSIQLTELRPKLKKHPALTITTIEGNLTELIQASEDFINDMRTSILMTYTFEQVAQLPKPISDEIFKQLIKNLDSTQVIHLATMSVDYLSGHSDQLANAFADYAAQYSDRLVLIAELIEQVDAKVLAPLDKTNGTWQSKAITPIQRPGRLDLLIRDLTSCIEESSQQEMIKQFFQSNHKKVKSIGTASNFQKGLADTKESFYKTLSELQQTIKQGKKRYSFNSVNYGSLSGNHAKTAILKKFESMINCEIKDLQSYYVVEQKIKTSPEYKILAKPQGISSLFFTPKKTHSIKELDNLLKQKKMTQGMDHIRPV